MFYSQLLLSKKGPLARLWTAAHWDRKLNKAAIAQTDIKAAAGEPRLRWPRDGEETSCTRTSSGVAGGRAGAEATPPKCPRSGAAAARSAACAAS